jgi:hypothetical protein
VFASKYPFLFFSGVCCYRFRQESGSDLLECGIARLYLFVLLIRRVIIATAIAFVVECEIVEMFTKLIHSFAIF